MPPAAKTADPQPKTYTVNLPRSAFTGELRQRLLEDRGCCNADELLGHAPGDVVYQQFDAEPYTVDNCKFMVRLSVTLAPRGKRDAVTAKPLGWLEDVLKTGGVA